MIEEIKRIASVIVPYTILCAFLNLYFYWNAFGIQPFEFISISEALAYSLPYLILATCALAPPFFIELSAPKDTALPSESEKERGLLIFILGLTIVLYIAIFIVAEMAPSINIAVYMGLISGMFPGAATLSESTPLKSSFDSKASRLFISIILCCLPAASIVHAAIKRAPILDRSSYFFIQSSDLNGNTESVRLIYIGHLGEYIFLMRENETRTLLYRMSDLKKLELRRAKIART